MKRSQSQQSASGDNTTKNNGNGSATTAILTRAKEALENAKEKGAGLLLLTGAGMSVASGVPVFRNANGTMSQEFTNFLNGYNTAREQNDLPLADDWFDFSVPEMFQPETEWPAWKYWKWRILRAKVQPGEDYQLLNQLIDKFFGGNSIDDDDDDDDDKVFCITSNCDGLHETAGLRPDQISEIHGSLSRVQCTQPCHKTLYPVDDVFVQQLQQPNWQVPRCPNCTHCLRPNVMVFGDYALMDNVLDEQSANRRNFLLEQDDNFIVLEIGAGLVVPSIRHMAERYGNQSRYGLIRINPSKDCLGVGDVDVDDVDKKYFPIPMTSTEALQGLVGDETAET